MDQEEAITGIRKINISLAEREFKAKPIYAYDVFISEKEYAVNDESYINHLSFVEK